MNASSHAKPNSTPPLWTKLNAAPMTVNTTPKNSIMAASQLFSRGAGWLVGGKFIKSFQRGLLLRRQIRLGSQPAQLQRADIRNDGPAVLGGHQRAIRAHRALA